MYDKRFEPVELTRTTIFLDPMNPNRFIRGVLFGRKTNKGEYELHHMDILFYKNKKDKTPYWTVTESCLYSQYDDKSIAYHRRPLFRGLINNLIYNKKTI